MDYQFPNAVIALFLLKVIQLLWSVSLAILCIDTRSLSIAVSVSLTSIINDD